MNVTIKYNDGKVVDLEGTPQELQGVLLALLGPPPFQGWTLQQAPWYQPLLAIGQPIVIDACVHEFPFPWNSTGPASCKKCGQVASQFVFTNIGATNTNIDNVLDPITYS